MFSKGVKVMMNPMFCPGIPSPHSYIPVKVRDRCSYIVSDLKIGLRLVPVSRKVQVVLRSTLSVLFPFGVGVTLTTTNSIFINYKSLSDSNKAQGQFTRSFNNQTNYTKKINLLYNRNKRFTNGLVYHKTEDFTGLSKQNGEEINEIYGLGITSA